MRLSLVSFGVLVISAGLAHADTPGQNFASAGIGPYVIDLPSGPTFTIPGLTDALEKSLSESLPNGDRVSLYAGYPGQAATGPKVDSPLMATLGNLGAPTSQNWLDSGFLAYGVVTAGFAHADSQFEVSQFAGRGSYSSPYDITRLNSTAIRYTWNLDSHWMLQGSWGSLKEPEYFAPQINETRWTASAKYTLPFGRSGVWSAMFAWGLKQETIGTNLGPDLNAVALDTECKTVDGWTLFAHGGLEQNNMLFASGALNPVSVTNAGAVSLGAVHDWTLLERVKLGAGGLYGFDLTPQLPGATPVEDTRGAVAYLHLVVR